MSLFQLHDVDVRSIGNNPITVRLFGRNDQGSAVTLLVKNFKPYFYVSSKNNSANLFSKRLRHLLIDDRSFRDSCNVSITHTSLKSIYGFNENAEQLFKISYDNLFAKQKVCSVIDNHFGRSNVSYFETNVDHTMQFMVDANVKGFDWISNVDNSYDMFDIRVEYVDVRKHAPFRVLSFDIECEVRENVFPQPDLDRIIVAACVLQNLSTETIVEKVVFTLRSCADFDDNTVILRSFHNESDMLCAFLAYVKQCDADIITGYNITSFDLYFVYSRCVTLNLPQHLFNIGKLDSRFCVKKSMKTHASQRFDKYYITLPGRVIFDVFVEIMKNYKLRSYKLNDVAKHFINSQKDDVRYTEITPLFNGSPSDRRKLAVYCLQDALLPLQLMNKLKLLTNAIEMCRVTGLSLQMLVNRGQQIKIMSQLLRECRLQQYVIPTIDATSSGESGYTGALVIEPKKSYYREPIVVLDFASLYPSIMIRHNLCYCTLLSKEQVMNMSSDDYTQTESNAYFVKQHIRKGILPTIVESLLAKRAEVKRAFANESNEHIKRILDGKQLALKICANSVYGFTGAQRGFLPCISISESVTTFGQCMLRNTKHLIEEHFRHKNGYEFDAKVVYGDTDSVFVHFGNVSLAIAKKLGIQACKIVEYKPPIKLEFEKVYESLLLLNRKKYSGLITTINDDGQVCATKIDNKGIEICRRDNCKLVADAQSVVLNELLVNKSPENAASFIAKLVTDLRSKVDDISLDLLTITKELKRDASLYKSKQAHVELVKRMQQRGDINTPQVNDRVPFVVVRRVEDGRKTKLYDRVEHPEFYIRNKNLLSLDVDYYVNTQLYPSISKILLNVFNDSEVNALFGRTARNRAKRKVKCFDIRTLFEEMNKQNM